MNEKATRPAFSRQNAMAMPGHRQRPHRQRRGGGQHPPFEVAGVEVLAAHRRAGLAHLGAQDHRDRIGVAAHGQGDAEVANHRADDVASPGAVGATEAFAALQPDAGGEDGLLPERPEAFALECLQSPPHFPAGEQLLQPVVHGAGEAHPAQDVLPLVAGERRGDRLPLQPAVAGVEHLRAGLLQAPDRRGPGRRFVEPIGSRDGVIEPTGQLAAEDRPQGLEPGAIARLQLAAAGGVEDFERQMDEGGVLFGHERAEARREAGGTASRDRTGHAGTIVAARTTRGRLRFRDQGPGTGKDLRRNSRSLPCARDSVTPRSVLPWSLVPGPCVTAAGCSWRGARSDSCSRTPPSSDRGRSCTWPGRSTYLLISGR